MIPTNLHFTCVLLAALCWTGCADSLDTAANSDRTALFDRIAEVDPLVDTSAEAEAAFGGCSDQELESIIGKTTQKSDLPPSSDSATLAYISSRWDDWILRPGAIETVF